jgi:hypothetical protein
VIVEGNGLIKGIDDKYKNSKEWLCEERIHEQNSGSPWKCNQLLLKRRCSWKKWNIFSKKMKSFAFSYQTPFTKYISLLGYVFLKP